MNALLVGCARVSTEQQDLTAQRDGLHALGVMQVARAAPDGLDGYGSWLGIRHVRRRNLTFRKSGSSPSTQTLLGVRTPDQGAIGLVPSAGGRSWLAATEVLTGCADPVVPHDGGLAVDLDGTRISGPVRLMI